MIIDLLFIRNAVLMLHSTIEKNSFVTLLCKCLFIITDADYFERNVLQVNLKNNLYTQFVVTLLIVLVNNK